MAARLPTRSTLTQEEVWGVVLANRGLCGAIARRFLGRGLDFDDLLQEGLFGLHRAVLLFDPARVRRDGEPIEFSTYAGRWIRQAMQAAICDTGRTVRVCRQTYMLAGRVTNGKLDLRDLAPLRRRCVVAALTVAAVWPIEGEGVAVAEDLEARPERFDAGLLEEVRAAIDRLDGRHREVIRLRFGLDEGPPMLLREVAAVLGLTRERIRQIQNEAIAVILEHVAG